MSEFSVFLDGILKARRMSGAQAARLCRIDTTVLFRWLSGASLPRNWKRLEGLTEKLRLTPYEMEMLEFRYRKEVLGETHANCFGEILKTLHTLAEKRAEYRLGSSKDHAWPLSAEGEGTLPGFRKLDHKLDLMQCVQAALTASLSEGQKSLCFKLQVLPEWLLVQLKQFQSRSGNPIEMFVYTSSTNGTIGMAEQKLVWMRQMGDLLITKNPADIYFYNGLEELDQMRQNWLVSERFLIQFPSDLSCGMITRDPAWIAFFQESFEELKAQSGQFCKCNKEVMEFLDSEEQLIKLQCAGVDFMPCISVGLTEQILQENILPDLPGRDEMIQGILRYPNCAARMQRVHSVFSRGGLRKFMEYGVVDLFPYKVYRPLSIEQRCEVLENMIFIQEHNLSFHYILLKDDFADMQGICVEQRYSENGQLHIYISLEEGKKEEIAIADPDIREEYARFFGYLKGSWFVYSEEETLAYMKKELRRYRG